MLIVLDAGPLGLLSNPTTSRPVEGAWAWASARLDDGCRFVVPEIADYEVRRELIRAGKDLGVERLDLLAHALGYAPITTAVMRHAAALWADARNSGIPTAVDPALDADVILAAQALSLGTDGETVVVATTNVTHLKRYVEARLWSQVSGHDRRSGSSGAEFTSESVSFSHP